VDPAGGSGAADGGEAAAAWSGDTTTGLSAQIVSRATDGATRFDVQLDPAGLGRVTVSMEIDAKGGVSAALAFEKPETASLFSAHAGELQQALAQAGFDLSSSNLSFATVNPEAGRASQTPFFGGDGGDAAGGDGGASDQGRQARTAGRAFGAASFAADQADQIYSSATSLRARGLDIRI
jgi:Meckel syndrome type 1 protein